MQSVTGGLPTTPKRGRPIGADSAETRRRILEAGRRVIAERGFQAATFQEIATEAGVTRPAVNHYFKSRQEIFNLLAAEGREILAECTAAVQGHDAFVAQLSALIAALHHAQIRDPSQLAFMVSTRLELMRHPELAIRRGGIGINRLLTEMIRDARVRGELPAHMAVAPLADMLQALLWGMAFYVGFIDTAAETGPMYEMLDGMISHGLLAAAAAVPPDPGPDARGGLPLDRR